MTTAFEESLVENEVKLRMQYGTISEPGEIPTTVFIEAEAGRFSLFFREELERHDLLVCDYANGRVDVIGGVLAPYFAPRKGVEGLS